MEPEDVGRSYDTIAERWSDDRFPLENGMVQHRRALAFVERRGPALDVGCGSSGRILALLLESGFDPEAVDVSQRMIELARQRHPDVTFHHADICEWTPPGSYEFISAWDSIWHVPLAAHERVLNKLLHALNAGGVCIFTMGGLDEPSEKRDAVMGPSMYYSTLGIPKTLEILTHSDCVCRHLEYDQYPEPHLYVIAQKLPSDAHGTG